MARHWNPRTSLAKRSYRPRPVRLRDFSWGEIRLVLLGGLMLGLLYAGFSSGGEAEPETDITTLPVPDYWAESKKSREILEAQEGAPSWAAEAVGDGGAARVRDASAVVVIDGDTFRLSGESIRIADIDTPEVNGRCPYETALAGRATRRMGELLAQGPFELHPIDRDQDRYGRKLRIVTRNGRSLGDQLVSEGLARTWTGRREPWC